MTQSKKFQTIKTQNIMYFYKFGFDNLLRKKYVYHRTDVSVIGLRWRWQYMFITS